MKMNAVKETRIANMICASIESEHGKVELVFEGWGIDSEDTTAQYLSRYVVKFNGEHYQVNECRDDNFCHGDFKTFAIGVCEQTWFMSCTWEDTPSEMCERAELFTLLGSAMAYIKRQLWQD